MADDISDSAAEPLRDRMAPRSDDEDTPPRTREARSTAEAEERELWSGGISAKFFYGQWIILILISILLLTGGTMLRSRLQNNIPLLLALALTLLGIVVLVVKIVREKLRWHYRLTSQRLFIEEGVLKRTVNQTDLVRVNDVSVTQKLLDRIFNVGNVKIYCPSDISNTEIEIRGIRDPHQVAEHIHGEMRAIRDRKTLMMEAT
jgi:membrane protein YdbS with pleckstrin-like domain